MRQRPLVVALTRIYSCWLLFLPPRLRREYGSSMTAVFADRLAEDPGGGASRIRIVARATRSFADVLAQGVAARFPPRGRRSRGDRPGKGGRGGGIMAVRTDVRLALRALRRSPTYALATFATFAFAIGAVSAVCSAVKGLLLDPLPFPEPRRLVFIGETGLPSRPEAYVTSRYVLERVGAEVPALKSVSAYNIWETIITGVGDPKRLNGSVVSAEYFEALGRPPLVGRTFRAEDDLPDAPRRVVISHRLWRSRFGADPHVVGRAVRLTGDDYEIVGVMPADFETPDEYTFASRVRGRPDVWRTFRGPSGQQGPGNRSHRGVARLAPGTSLGAARSQLDALGARIGEEFPEWRDSSQLRALTLQEQFTIGARPTLLLLLAGVSFVLVAACVNVMGLTLARGLDRASDLRVRTALGAGRGALLRQLVTETLVLGALGGVAGIGIAALGVDAFLAVAPPDIPRIDAIRLDRGTVSAVFTLTLAAAAAAGLVPSFRLLWGRSSLAGGAGTRSGTPDRAQLRTLAAFSVAQVAFAMVLLAGSGLLMRSFTRLVATDPGYDPKDVVVAQLDLPDTRYPELADRRRALDEILRLLREDDAVAEAGLVTSVPHHGLNNFSFVLDVDGTVRDTTSERPWARYRGVSPGYAEAMGVRVVQGRMIEREDWSETTDGALHLAGVAVSEEFVRRWIPPGTPAVGTPVDLGGMLGAGEVPIVGVVGNVRYESLSADEEPEIYLPITGRFYTVFLVAKARDPRAPLASRMKEVVQSVDPLLPMDDVFHQERLLAAATSQDRMRLVLMGALSVFALILGAMGVYGVVAYGVARRERELGIRMAIGAAGSSLRREILGQGGMLAATGASLGLAAAWEAARLLGHAFRDVDVRDPVAFTAAALVVMSVSLLATWIPARRATRVDPAVVLRAD